MDTWIDTEVAKNKQVIFKKLIVGRTVWDDGMVAYVKVNKCSGKVTLNVWSSKKQRYIKRVIFQ